MKQQHGRKRTMLIMINVDYLETAARQKKVMLIMINVDHLETAARQKKDNVDND